MFIGWLKLSQALHIIIFLSATFVYVCKPDIASLNTKAAFKKILGKPQDVQVSVDGQTDRAILITLTQAPPQQFS